MTAIVRTAQNLPDRPDLLRRRVTGTPAEVEATLGIVRAGGHLVAASVPTAVHGDPRRVTTTVTLRVIPHDPGAALAVKRGPGSRRRLVKPMSIAGGIVVGLAGLGWALSLLIGATVHAAAAVSPAAVLGVLAVVAGAVLLLRGGSGSGCSGLHCGGCGGGH